MTIFKLFRQKEHKKKNYQIALEKSKRLKRIKEENKTRIIGASEEEIQEIKTGLDTAFIFGRGHEQRQAERELRRLGFLH
jgi:hypothetical protein